ncbi:MAG: hypothetical protein J0L84_02100 [Verrucomicrobia bacterium]|nr:hypothetical protein [Verrucomicrobiota bacterium]
MATSKHRAPRSSAKKTKALRDFVAKNGGKPQPKPGGYQPRFTIIVAQQGDSPLWFFDLLPAGQEDLVMHERTSRSYASASDCLVSARHLVNELKAEGLL